MNLFLGNLFALIEETPATPESGGLSMVFPLVAMGAIIYFLLIAPERKQRKKREAMLGELKKGDEVMTSGGMLGKVIEAREDRVTLQVADNTRLTFSRQAVQTVLDADGKPAGEAPKKA